MTKLTEPDLESFSIAFIEKQGYNHSAHEHQARKNLCDTILPKLMSGEVSVITGSAVSAAPTTNRQG